MPLRYNTITLYENYVVFGRERMSNSESSGVASFCPSYLNIVGLCIKGQRPLE